MMISKRVIKLFPWAKITVNLYIALFHRDCLPPVLEELNSLLSKILGLNYFLLKCKLHFYQCTNINFKCAAFLSIDFIIVFYNNLEIFLLHKNGNFCFINFEIKVKKN